LRPKYSASLSYRRYCWEIDFKELSPGFGRGFLLLTDSILANGT
jgi:hypothetical protein